MAFATSAMAQEAATSPQQAEANPAVIDPASPSGKGADLGGTVIDEILVTAQKRSENLQSVPISITAISGDQLAQRQIRIAEDLVTSVPNLQINSPLGDGLPVFSLRGISMSDFSLAQSGPVAVYYDEVYKGNFAILGLGLFDLERVEVLKGPQGTLYGKNTTGGAINLITRKPSFETGGNLSVGYGNDDRYSADGAFETALGDALGARLAFTFDRADGWMKNAYPNAPDSDSTRQYGLRGSLRYAPNDTVDLVIRASTTLQNPMTYGTVAIPGPDGVGAPIYSIFGLPTDFRSGLGKREINTPDISRQNLRTHALAAHADIQLSNALTLTSITSWDRGEIRFAEDSDGTPLVMGLATYYGRTQQVTQDLRLTSGFGSPFNFILGAYFSDEDIRNATNVDFLTDLDVNGSGSIDGQDCVDGGFFLACNVHNQFRQEKTSYAAYFDATYELTDQFTLRGGLRYTHDGGKLRDFLAQVRGPDKMPLINSIPGSETDLFATTSRKFEDDNVTGKIGIDYTPTERVLLYGSYSRGYRGAAFNGQAYFGATELTIAEPEELEAVEAGIKSELFDRRVRLNAAAFWYSYTNQQVLDVDPATSLQVLINLPESRIYGAEIDVQFRPTDRLTLSTGVGLLDTEVQRGSSQGLDIRGNRLISAPGLTLTSSVDWSLPLGVWGAADARVDLAHASAQYYDLLNRPSVRENGYTLLNSRIRFHPDDDRYGVALWVKNLTNEYYYTNKVDLLSGFGFTYTHVNDPRTYGVTVDIKF